MDRTQRKLVRESMEISYLVFLYTAEEKSITKGAARARVSQQCASQHIRNLERKLGTSLLCRHPFTLTAAGKQLAEGLQHLETEERQLQKAVGEIISGERGMIRIGCNATRARLLFPGLLARYGENYPKVRFTFFFGDTVELIRQLHTGKLDMVIGVNQQAQPQLERIPLLEETLFFVCQPKLVEQALPGKKVGQRLTLEEISRLPLCLNLPESTLTQMLERQAAKENVLLEPACTCSDYTYQIDLCQAGLCGCFLPETLLPLWQGEVAAVWPLAGMEEKLHIDLICAVTAARPRYEKVLIRMIRQAYQRVEK